MDKTQLSTTQQKSNLLPILVMFCLFFMIAFVTNFAGSMGIIVKTQFNASNALSQLGTLANFIAYACMGIPAGIILKRKGYKFTSLLAVTIGFIGVGVQWLAGPTESFAVYVCGAFIAGFSMCLLNIVTNPMLNTLGGGGNRGNQLIQFGGSCNSVGGTIAPILLGYLVGSNLDTATVSDVAPAMMIAMAIFVLAFVIIFFTNIPEPHLETAAQRAAEANDTHSPLSFRHFVFGALAIFFYVGVEVSIPNFANLYMTTLSHEQADEIINIYERQQADSIFLAECMAQDAANLDDEEYEELVITEARYNQAYAIHSENEAHGQGVSAAAAGCIVSLYWILMMIGRLIGGAVGSKVSSKTMLIVSSAVAIFLVLCTMIVPESARLTLFSHVVPVNMFVLVLCGLCTSVMWGAIFNLATKGLGKYTPEASGIFMTLVCGGGIIPLIQGWVTDTDAFEFTTGYVITLLCFVFILWYALWGSKNVNQDIVTE